MNTLKEQLQAYFKDTDIPDRGIWATTDVITFIKSWLIQKMEEKQALGNTHYASIKVAMISELLEELKQ